MDYNIEPIDTSEKGLGQVTQLLQACFPDAKKFTEQFLKWQYVDNPCGKVHGYNAFLNGELAAHYATIPVDYIIKGKKCKGLLSLNTATALNHRGKKLFKNLAEKTYETAKDLGYEFIIGVANANSTHGFVNKMQFQLVAPLEVKIGFGDVKGDENLIQLKSIKGENWLKWRLSNPAQRYNIFKKGVYSEFIKPFLIAYLSKAISTNRSFFGVTLWIGLTPKSKTRGLLVNFPDKLKPSPLNLIFRDLTGAIGQIDKHSVDFELLDFDAY